ncbi:MAG: [Fe-Fe] hydrogenase large subunit C-terminal domain-containing protein [Dehalococcoidales bacterium]|nr:[Fe-Fe] hydrogenase large subunit C-terminal domain-containing protein [Dehalococcoidales bacterium]
MSTSIIHTDRDKCKGCYACVRDCPAKAIKVEEGLAQVMKERCIACGNCLEVCATGAKQLESDVGVVWQLLAEHAPVIAVLSSSCPAALPHVHPRQLVTALQKLGFKEVMEDSFGAELVAREYARLLTRNKGKSIISSNCPAVVLYVEKYHPGLIANLAPIASPTIASGRLIKWRYNPAARVVFIGPCVAKKVEAKNEKFSGVIDAVLTFAELREMFAARDIKPETEARGQFSGPKPNMGRLFGIAGGLLKVMGLSDDILLNDVISAHGRDYVVKMLREFAQSGITARFVNLYFCHGCISGPVIRNELSGFRRKQLIANYTRSEADPVQTEQDIEKYAGIDLSREFMPQGTGLATPKEEEITAVLQQMERVRPEEQFNCGACGYSSCRELAIAVCQGLGEKKMCWPLVLKRLRETQEGLIQAEKLTSLGQMAASIAHEVNNPLAGVLVYTQLLEKKINSGTFSETAALEYLGKMETELTRSSRLIKNLLDFARQSAPTLRQVNLNEVMNRSFELTAHSAQLKHIQVVKELSPSLPTTMADFDQLQQVLLNLIMNAIQAMPEGGILTLRSALDTSEVKVEVQDNGCGISPENMRKLFTPFFTTKREVKGVGLGLAVAYGIVQRHRGRIEVQSKEGVGTTFTIYLPLVQK